MTIPLVLHIFFSVTFLSVTAYEYWPLNTTDEHGCGIGEEFRGGSCKKCFPGTYRFISPYSFGTRPAFECTEIHDHIIKNDDWSYLNIEPSSSKCVPCPAGRYNPFHGAQSSSRCLRCPPGTTSAVGSKKCIKCPAGQSSSTGSPRCVTCWRGHFIMNQCSPDGKRWTTKCTKCPKGMYSSGRNNVECTPCPAGTSTKAKGSWSQKFCKPCGTNGVKCSCQKKNIYHVEEPWNAISSFRPIGASVCTNCPPGTRALTPFATKVEQCIPCPLGTEHTRFDGCKKCAEGMKSFGKGASYCRKKWSDKCPSDSFKDAKGVCKRCPVGYAWNLMTRQCKRCPEGSTAGGGSETTCWKCIFPTVPSPDSGSCACTRGFFQDYYDSKCKRCPKGTKKEKEVHSDLECDGDCDILPEHPSCQGCKEGNEWDDDSQTCQKCGKGLYSQGGDDRCVVPQTGCAKGQKLSLCTFRAETFVECRQGTL